MQTLLILVLALVGAAGSYLTNERPEPIELIQDAWMRTPEDVAGLGAVLWVDARNVDQYHVGHIEGAVNVSLQDWDIGLGELLTVWSPEQDIVVYCDGEGCALSRETAEKLRADLATDNIYWLQGGIQAWEEFTLR
ncbi:rhodanese-like domain-containing protein [Cerasicoccus maritimus]|uniref:rhodanese-like domain-containing protein n=1 Tax=Cerasicoccus maritimus TaxID=490089 RepID=UPI0028524CE7|nr:rhodanese-like domain-containing protein [Cerasicoccus maritimus]